MGIKRRNFLYRMGLGLGSMVTASSESATPNIKKRMDTLSPIISINPMGFQWDTLDPFLFSDHHEDHFPKGNAHMGPAESLEGRGLGEILL